MTESVLTMTGPRSVPSDDALSRVDALYQAGILRELDRHLARAFARLCPNEAPEVLLTAALASRAVTHGHVCLDLETLRRASAWKQADGTPVDLGLPTTKALVFALESSPLVATEPEQHRPLVLEGTRLYLERYADYERRLAACLLDRAARRPLVDEARLQATLKRLFPNQGKDGASDLQRVATVLAVRSAFSVVSGGPGTGKTTTVVKMLAALQEQTGALRLLLLAPTGKAASRLAEAIRAGIQTLDTSEEIRRNVPQEASTIHRALGSLRHAPSRFRHDANHPLPADVVLVDEASMVDLALLTKLVEAVPPEARLILLGDKDQLASVEAGAILGDLFHAERTQRYSSELAAELARLSGDQLPPETIAPASASDARGLLDCTVHLTSSYRYAADSGIGQVARAINRGDGAEAERVLVTSSDAQLHAPTATDREYPVAVQALVQSLAADWLTKYAAAPSPESALDELTRFRVLCAHREGPLGVGALNEVLERVFLALSESAGTTWYHLRPILVTANDYQLGVFNGDVGVIFRHEDGTRWAYFAGREGLVRHLPARLPAHETVFAMTIHKSQGSEFERVVCVLPLGESELATRELVYTALTRASRRVDVVARPGALALAAARRIHRASGLREKLWGAQDGDAITRSKPSP